MVGNFLVQVFYSFRIFYHYFGDVFIIFFLIYVLVLFVMITELTIKQLPCKLMDYNHSFETCPGFDLGFS
jgi:hypothetical protein